MLTLDLVGDREMISHKAISELRALDGVPLGETDERN
jgi:hypothetical protein